ncbi:geranylgeranylglycerol-phosphate geranylgeranyltransferase [candidate division KSB1 bacterium]|nr:geranylgeranylglycerol-phosphate geranylgeranyltransferase [candidate division KSB1 bacterium]
MNAYFQITRPVNVLIGGLSIFIGAFIAGSIQPIQNVALAVLSGMLIAAAANTINDYYDVAIDRINKPYRPIPSGKITEKTAWIYAMIMFVIGTGLSILINNKALAIAVFAWVVLYCYSAKLKRTVLWGNLAVSFMTAFAFIYGGVAVNRLNEAIIPAVFSFLFHLGREIIKDIEDREGDSADHAVTLPIRYGVRPALWVTMFVFILLIGLTIMPFVMGIFGVPYLWVVILGVDTVLVFVIFSMWKTPVPKNLGRLSTLLKMDMLVGLIAIYVGRF